MAEAVETLGRRGSCAEPVARRRRHERSIFALGKSLRGMALAADLGDQDDQVGCVSRWTRRY